MPCRSQSRPHRSAGGWHRYAYTSTPGTRPPRNPSDAATASSWILLADAVAVLNATTEYASTAAQWTSVERAALKVLLGRMTSVAFTGSGA